MFERDTGCPGPQSNGYPREPVKRDRLHPRVRPGPPVGQPASSTKPKHPSLGATLPEQFLEYLPIMLVVDYKVFDEAPDCKFDHSRPFWVFHFYM